MAPIISLKGFLVQGPTLPIRVWAFWQPVTLFVISVMFPNQSSLVGSRVGHSVPPISRTIHVGFRNMLSSGFGFATSDAPLWLGVLGIQWVFANNPLMFSAGFVTHHLLFRVDCVGNLVRTPHKKKPGHCKPGSRIAFQLLHTYIYIHIHMYVCICINLDIHVAISKKNTYVDGFR